MNGEAPGPDRLRTLVRGAIVAAFVAAAWLLLGGIATFVELLAGLAVGAAAGVTDWAVRRYTGHRAGRAAGDWWRHLPRLIGVAYRDCWTVSRALAGRLRGQPLAGRFRTVPFHVGDDGHVDVGRRTLTTYGVTLSPNSYVVGFDGDRDEVLVHELVHTEDGPIPRALAGAS